MINLNEVITFYPLYLIVRLILIFPLYQITLIAISFCFGEYQYFKKFMIKFLNYFRFR